MVRSKKKDRSGSIYRSQQCEAETLGKRQCRQRTARGKMCWIHLKKLKGLRVKKSKHGLGLFTTRDIKPKKIITPYEGERMTKQQAARKYPKNDARYMLCSNTTNLCVDGRLSNSGVGRFVNSAYGSGKANNSKYTDRYLNVKSKRNIKAGTEITIAYGPGHKMLQPRDSKRKRYKVVGRKKKGFDAWI